MIYEVMDVCDMKYEDNFFDIAIDKSTIDTILCGENPILNNFIFIKECQRVIKEDGGVYLAITLGGPESRINHYKRRCFSWDVKQISAPKTGTQSTSTESSRLSSQRNGKSSNLTMASNEGE